MNRQNKRWVPGAVLLAVVLSTGCDLLGGDHLKKARDYESKGDVAAAIIEYKTVLQGEPDNEEVRRTLGRLYIEAGDGVAAEKELRRALTLRPDEVVTRLMLIRALVMQGKFDPAMEAYRALPEIPDGLRPESARIRGLIRLGQNRLDEARKAFEEALSLDGGDVEALVGLARVHAIEGDDAKARSILDEALARSPDDVEAWMLRAGIELRAGDHEAAIEAYRRAWNQGRDVNRIRSVKARLGLVQAFMAAGRLDEALPHVEALLKQLPNHPLPHFLRGQIAYQKEDLVLARDQLLQVVRVQPRHAPSHLLLGAIAYRQGELAQAETHLQEYLVAVPKDVQARKLLAATRLRMNTPGLALKTLEPILEKVASDPQALALAGKASLQKGDLEKGVELLQKALSEDPENDALRLDLSTAYLSMGDSRSAIEELTRSGDGNNRRGRTVLVFAHIRAGELDEAKALVSRMEEDGEPVGRTAYLRGVIALAENRLANAYDAFRKAVQAAPDDVPSLLALGRIELMQGRTLDAVKRFDAVLALDDKNLDAQIGEAMAAMRRGDEEAMLSWLDKAIVDHKTDLRPKLILARYYLQTGRLDQARMMIDEAQSIEADNQDVRVLDAEYALASRSPERAERIYRELAARHPGEVRHLFGLARAQLASGRPDAARKTLRRLLDAHPDLLAAREMLARIEIARGDDRAADAEIAKIGKQRNGERLAKHLRGDQAFRQGRLEAALRIYREIAEAHPDDRLAMIKIYRTRKRMGDDRFIETLERWLEEHPDDLQTVLIVAQEAMAAKRYDRAIRYYEKALAANPKDQVVLNNLAWLYGEVGDDRALDYAKRAYEIDPGVAAVADTYGWLLVGNDRPAEGIQVLERALARLSSNDVRYHLAVAYARAGRKEKARRLLDEMKAQAAPMTQIDEVQRALDL